MKSEAASKILIVDDEVAIRQLLVSQLRTHGFITAEAGTGEAALETTERFHPHLLILDLGLPGMSGLQVLKSLRHWTKVPILILTVNDEERSKVELLDAGADDYLTKPFSVSELLARVRVCLRTHGLIEATPIFQSGDLKVNLNSREITVQNSIVKLTNTEFELLAALIREQGRVVPQTQLLKQIWGTTSMDQSHYLRIYVNQLRKKIEPNPSIPMHLITESGVGYRIV
jgi:two-component system KDP operon response regulator KdpE